MQNIFILLPLVGALLLCGCGKQETTNARKIDELTQKLAALQLIQSNQLAGIHSQINAIAPTMDKLSDSYFEKSHEDAIFFHTNTLYLLLLVDQKIEAELRIAANQRNVESELAHHFHTNQMAATYQSATQIVAAVAEQGNLIETNINARTRQMIAILRDDLLEQIKASESSDAAAETAVRKQMLTTIADQANQTQTNVNVQTRQMIAVLRDDLFKEIKASVPDATAETVARNQLLATIADQANQTQTNVNAQTRQMIAVLRDELLKQIKASEPDASAETVARNQMLATIANQANQTQTNVNAQTRQMVAVLRDDLLKQIKTSESDTADETAVRKQMLTTIADQANQTQTNVNAQTRQMIAVLRDELLKQIKASGSDAAVTAASRQMAADLAQLKSDLAGIKARLENLNPPAARP